MARGALLGLFLLLCVGCSQPTDTAKIDYSVAIEGPSAIIHNLSYSYSINLKYISSSRALVYWVLNDSIVQSGGDHFEFNAAQDGEYVLTARVVDKMTHLQIAGISKHVFVSPAVVRINVDTAGVEAYTPLRMSVTWIPAPPEEPYYIRWQCDTTTLLSFSSDTCMYIPNRLGALPILVTAYSRSGHLLTASSSTIVATPPLVEILGPSVAEQNVAARYTARVATGSRFRLRWNFEDGTAPIDDATTVEHTFSLPGVYSLTVLALYGKDTASVERRTITVPAHLDADPAVTLSRCTRVVATLSGKLRWSGSESPSTLSLAVDSLKWTGSRLQRNAYDSTKLTYGSGTKWTYRTVACAARASSAFLDSALFDTSLTAYHSNRSGTIVENNVAQLAIAHLPLVQCTPTSITFSATGSRCSTLVSWAATQSALDQHTTNTLQSVDWTNTEVPPNLTVTFSVGK